MKFLFRRLLAWIFGEKIIGVDYSYGTDKTIRSTGFILFDKIYITKVEEIE